MNLFYEWNAENRNAPEKIHVLDDTLRDGLQSPSARVPGPAEKRRILTLAARIGVQCTILGLPASGPKAVSDISKLAEFLAAHHPQIEPMTAVRTHPDDIAAHRNVCQQSGVAVTAALFVGCSPIRAYVERWDLDQIISRAAESVRACVQDGIPVLFVTEDTTRAHPQMISDIYTAAMDEGSARICVADTVGHAHPSGVRALMDHMCGIVSRHGSDTGIDWHGHNDRGLALVNALIAADHGATRIHATGLGMGERTGNTSVEQLLVNLALRGALNDRSDLTALMEYCEAVHRYCAAPLPNNLPIVGSDAFRTSSGIHAAALRKAMHGGDLALVDAIYSGVPATMLGRRQEIEIGPMSGASNVRHWLDLHHPSLDDVDCRRLTDRILDNARRSRGVLTDKALNQIVAPVCSKEHIDER